MYFERYQLSLGTPFEMTMNSVRFTKYINGVEIPNQYTVHNPSDLLSSKRLCKGSSYIDLNGKRFISTDIINIKVLRNLY